MLGEYVFVITTTAAGTGPIATPMPTVPKETHQSLHDKIELNSARQRFLAWKRVSPLAGSVHPQPDFHLRLQPMAQKPKRAEALNPETNRTAVALLSAWQK